MDDIWYVTCHMIFFLLFQGKEETLRMEDHSPLSLVDIYSTFTLVKSITNHILPFGRIPLSLTRVPLSHLSRGRSHNPSTYYYPVTKDPSPLPGTPSQLQSYKFLEFSLPP